MGTKNSAKEELMLIVGERINASRKSIAEAIEARKKDLIQDEARAQDTAGADYIDVNAASLDNREADSLKWVVESVQEVTDKPLCIDSPDPEVIRSVLPMVEKTPMINSITLEARSLETILPLVKEYRTKVIGLCQSETVIAKSLKEKTSLADRLIETIQQADIPLDDLYIDPLIFPLAADISSAVATLNAIEEITQSHKEVHTICGLSNASHGLPQRKLINKTLLAAAVVKGLNAVIMDPTDEEVYGVLRASEVVAGKDDFCMQYIAAFREGRLS